MEAATPTVVPPAAPEAPKGPALTEDQLALRIAARIGHLAGLDQRLAELEAERALRDKQRVEIASELAEMKDCFKAERPFHQPVDAPAPAPTQPAIQGVRAPRPQPTTAAPTIAQAAAAALQQATTRAGGS